MDQRALELEMVDIGKRRADTSHEKAEEKGRASTNPYASAIHRRFVEPLAAVLAERYTNAGAKRGRTARVRALLDGLDPLVLAYLTTRGLLDRLVPQPGIGEVSLASALGRTMYGEVLLRSFESINPALFHVLTRDLSRRMSKDERHRIRVFRHEAQHHGIPFPEWSQADRILVGGALIHEAGALGLVTRTSIARAGKTHVEVSLDPAITGLLDQIKEFVSLTLPCKMPCVEPPRPWVAPDDGGWHTEEMRRSSPTCISGESFVKPEDVPQPVLGALNKLQSVPWQINARMLDTVTTVARHFDVGEVLTQEDLPKPPKPAWLEEGIHKEDMDELQLDEFLRWKGAMAAWHTMKKERAVKWGRFYEALRIARKFKDLQRIFFVWTADYRGRFYAQTRGVSPQGSDLQKALIRFERGGLISASPESIKWFKINGANRFGFDKAELDDRVKWVDERSKMIIRIAQDPVSYREWTEADKPFQFLAWCLEYADWVAFPKSARSHLAVGLDGSCNGLQHLSALSRDEVGGEATNLTPGPRRDIYEMVALELTRIIRELPPGEGYRDQWLRHGITRSLTKRSVMTLPYGATRYACSEFILKDYLGPGLVPEIPRDEYADAATWLSYPLWEAIGRVVVRGQGVMAWLQRAARRAVERGWDELAWSTPDGFRVRQRYAAMRRLSISSRLHGAVRLKFKIKDENEDRVDGRRHIQGIAPNFVHSLDATHMRAVIRAAEAAGMDSLAMIHDDYGTTPDRTQELYGIIRATYVDLYSEQCPLAAVAEEYGIEPYADRGTLDLSGVVNSEHFFS